MWICNDLRERVGVVERRAYNPSLETDNRKAGIIWHSFIRGNYRGQWYYSKYLESELEGGPAWFKL